jgi:hypothetical protein
MRRRTDAISKHRFSFETARLAFDDPMALSVQDRVVDGEQRWQTLGMTSGVLLIVAHTWIEEAGDEVVRLISARKATARERRAYAENQQRSGR